jgi:transposase
MRVRGEVSDEEWALLEPHLRFARRADGHGRPPADTRAVLNGVLWILRTGAQWRELPKKVSAAPNGAWAVPAVGALRAVGESAAHFGRETARKGIAGPEGRADRRQLRKRQKGGLAVGKTKRGRGNKIMAIAAVTSIPLAVTVDSASPHESKLVDATLAGSFLDRLPIRLIGDKASPGPCRAAQVLASRLVGNSR